MARLAITGASGFVGRATVDAALNAGHHVLALTRSHADLPSGVESHRLDLASGGAATELEPLLADVDAIIHAAASMVGDDATHTRDTLSPTRSILAAIGNRRLVLVSSLSVYGYAAIPDGTLLDELTPIEPDLQKRDAYARAKIRQEQMAVHAAQADGVDLWLIRPGAIYGPGRLSTARLGISVKGRLLTPSGNARVPAVDVASVGRGLVAAATVSVNRPSDVPIPHGAGRVTIVNLVDPDPPRQKDWARATGASLVSIPRKPLFRLLEALDLAGEVMPSFGGRIPTALKVAGFAARFRDLTYATQRAEDILSIAAGDGFDANMARYRKDQP
ncbi:MAG: NAD-dependent epimerase/dehydratase family protein [Pseudomonadota bacterium]